MFSERLRAQRVHLGVVAVAAVVRSQQFLVQLPAGAKLWIALRDRLQALQGFLVLTDRDERAHGQERQPDGAVVLGIHARDAAHDPGLPGRLVDHEEQGEELARVPDRLLPTAQHHVQVRYVAAAAEERLETDGLPGERARGRVDELPLHAMGALVLPVSSHRVARPEVLLE